MSEIITSLTEEQKQKYNEKFENIRNILWHIKTRREERVPTDEDVLEGKNYHRLKGGNNYEHEVLKEGATDPTIFANLFFVNKKGEPYKLYDYQDLVINDTSRLVVVAKGRKIGMTDVLALKAIHAALFNKSFTIVIASKTKPQAKIIIDRIKEFLLTARLLSYKDIKGDTDNKFELWIKNYKSPTFSKIVSIIAGDSARGYDAQILMIDEAAFIENGDYIYHEVLAPIVTYHNGQIILVSTPPKQAQGFFYEAFMNSVYSRYHFPSRTCPAITEKFLSDKRESMLESQYQREYEGKFLSDENCVYTQKEIEDATDNTIIEGEGSKEPVFVGIDWGETQSQCAYAIVKAEFIEGPTKTEVKTKLIAWKCYPQRTDSIDVIHDIQNICNKKYNVQVILADAGIGRGQISNMADMRSRGELNCGSIEEYTFGGTHKSDLVTENKLLFEKRRVKIPNDKQLINELTAYQQEYNDITKRTRYHAPEAGRVRDHLLDAFHLANMAAVRLAAPPVTCTVV